MENDYVRFLYIKQGFSGIFQVLNPQINGFSLVFKVSQKSCISNIGLTESSTIQCVTPCNQLRGGGGNTFRLFMWTLGDAINYNWSLITIIHKRVTQGFPIFPAHLLLIWIKKLKILDAWNNYGMEFKIFLSTLMAI